VEGVLEDVVVDMVEGLGLGGVWRVSSVEGDAGEGGAWGV